MGADDVRLGFHKTPEQKVGALFWRMHRCARIIFSLNFHMGKWSPQEAIDFLVDKVGHERDNATAEVRRSFAAAATDPLYQAAYLLGGLQLRGLRKELVDSKAMTNKQFHDEIMRQGNMPIALHPAAASRSRSSRATWTSTGSSTAICRSRRCCAKNRTLQQSNERLGVFQRFEHDVGAALPQLIGSVAAGCHADRYSADGLCARDVIGRVADNDDVRGRK